MKKQYCVVKTHNYSPFNGYSFANFEIIKVGTAERRKHGSYKRAVESRYMREYDYSIWDGGSWEYLTRTERVSIGDLVEREATYEDADARASQLLLAHSSYWV